MKRRIVWSYGGGIQSVGMLCLMAAGQLPVPELAIIADTGRECSLTWRYTVDHALPVMDRLDLKLAVVPHNLAKRDLYSSGGILLLPVFTNYQGKRGKFPTYCSSEWKKLVIRRYLRLHGYGPEHPVALWLGISYDEFQRMRQSDVKWIEQVYPLCDLKITRQQCKEAIKESGLPIPPKTSCWMCPNRTNAEWRYMRDQAPADFQKAVTLEAEIREKDPDIWLHESRGPLAAADLTRQSEKDDLSDACANYCWT